MRDTKLLLDTMFVGVDCLGTDAELLPDLYAAVAFGHQSHYHPLAITQRLERLATNVRGALTSRRRRDQSCEPTSNATPLAAAEVASNNAIIRLRETEHRACVVARLP